MKMDVKYVSGRWYGNPGGAQDTVQLQGDRLYLLPLALWGMANFDAVAAGVYSAGSPDSVGKVAVYKSQEGKPGSLYQQSTQMGIIDQYARIFPLLGPTVLGPEIVWVAVVLKSVASMPVFYRDRMCGIYSWAMGANDANSALLDSASGTSNSGAAYYTDVLFDDPFPLDLAGEAWLETDIAPRVTIRVA